MQTKCFGGIVLGLALLTSNARADEPRKEKPVVLKNGDVVRGEIVEHVEGASCTLLLADDTVVTIPWGDIKSIDGRAIASPRPVTFVTIRTPVKVQLQHREDGRWVTTCMSPCNLDLPRDRDYRVVDEKGHPKSSFTLNASSVVVDVSPRSSFIDATGVLVAIGGFALMLAGTYSYPSRPALSGFGFGAILTGVAVLVWNGSSVSVTPTKERSVARTPPPLTLTSPFSFAF